MHKFLAMFMSSLWMKGGFSELASQESRPRILVMEGCSGSTFVQQLARKLLFAHGITARGPLEMLNPCASWEPHCKEQDIFWDHTTSENVTQAHSHLEKSLEKAVSFMHKKNRVFMSKVTFNTIKTNTPLREKLLKLKVTVAVVIRSNVLDVAVCQVRDCFGDEGYLCGHSVDIAGNRSDMCFARRDHPEVITMAKFDAKCLVEKLSSDWFTGVRYPDSVQDDMKILSTNYCNPITYEDLMAFQTNNHGALRTSHREFERSVLGWSALLLCWGVTPVQAHIAAVLRPTAETRSPSSHDRTIFNADEIRSALSNATESAVRRLYRENIITPL
mmetsp:Transcript_49921/g.98627  ORF Transcript_49921/g.98627 Transcript_49921/m.98627 type:complete len:331 (-) Transcript_49921:402-1394(-)